MSPYPPTSPPPYAGTPAAAAFCDAYAEKMHGMPTCDPSDNDGNPCCTQLGNQECKCFGSNCYCIRGGGG